jgi:hypothetical protein
MSWFILTGILERLPALRVLLVQGGSGWLATCGELLDWNYRYAQFVPGNGFFPLKDLPSDYLRRQVYATVEADQKDLRMLAERDRADKLLWSSAFPTSMSSWPESRSRADRQTAALDEAPRRALLAGNFDALYAGGRASPG